MYNEILKKSRGEKKYNLHTKPFVGRFAMFPWKQLRQSGAPSALLSR